MGRIAVSCCLLSVVLLGGCPERESKRPADAKGATPIEVVSRSVGDEGILVAGLSNGLTAIIAENHDAPVVCVRGYVRAGGLYEGQYLGAGISHLCEHLVAEGVEQDHAGAQAARAQRRPGKEDRIGGQANAYTSLDSTCYHISAASAKANECLDLVADWLARAAITRADFRREHGVVQRELEMGLDDPDRQLWQAHALNFYGTHPAAVPVIGHKEPLARLKYEDVLNYHRRMYVPENMVVVVVGDVEADSALERLCRGLGDLRPGTVPDLSLPEVSPLAATRRAVVRSRSVKDAAEELSFLTIPLVHEDLYALDVLSEVLTNGEASRLVRAVKRQAGLVTTISSSSWTPEWGKGLFTVHFRCEPGKLEAAEKAVLEELAKVVAQGVTPEELARAKRQKVAELVWSRQTVQARAAMLGSDYLSTGDVGFSGRYTDRIQKVAPQEVQAVAKKYFDFERMVITRLLPADYAGPAAATAPAPERPKTTSFRLRNGLRVVLHSAPSAELVSMTLVTRGGLLLETEKTNGMGTLMAMLATRGAGSMSAEQIAAFFDAAGGNVSGECGNNTFYWQATVLADAFDKTLPVFADVVLRPTYPEKELQIFRPVLLARIRRTDEDWHGLLNRLWREDFFGSSPVGMLPTGSTEVVKAAARQAVADYHDLYVKAGASVLAISGRFDPEKTAPIIEGLFGAMPAGDNALPDLAAPAVGQEGRTRVHPSPLNTAGIIVSAPGMRVADVKDCLAVDVLDTIISGYHLPRGWLHDELRGKELVYVVHAYNWPLQVPGAFVVYANCEPDKAEQVAGIIRDNLRKTLSHRFTPAEVEEAVNFILTAELLEKQSPSALSMQAALDELYGRGYDFRSRYEGLLRKVTPEEVARVARKYLGGGYVTTVVTPLPATTAPAGR